MYSQSFDRYLASHGVTRWRVEPLASRSRLLLVYRNRYLAISFGGARPGPRTMQKLDHVFWEIRQ